MSGIKVIDTGKCKVLAVMVPETYHSFRVSNFECVNDCLWFFDGLDTQKYSLDLPEGNWQIAGLSNELTEDQWDGLIDSELDFLDGFGSVMVYPDFTDKERCYITAKESGLSLLEANQCYSVNPLDKPTLNDFKDNLFCKSGDCKAYRDMLSEWELAESNTGSWLILKQI